MSADLHIHTTFSDGTATPEEVVKLAKKAGLKTISITDHDVIDGIELAKIEGERLSVNVIPGIELTTEIPAAEIHLLGYYIDYKLPMLTEILLKIQEDRRLRIYKIVEKLKALGITIDPNRIFEISGKGSPGRPHVARALKEANFVSSIREAFDKYLDYRAPAYVPHYRLSPKEAIKLILNCNGIPVYAHPATSRADQIIPDLLAFGLAGIEVYYIGHSEADVRHYLRLAQKYNLLITGGSDYHGLQSQREVELGELTIDDELVEKLSKARKL